jgi:hypothetical protein
MHGFRVWPTALGLLFLFACAPAPVLTGQATPGKSNMWKIAFTQSGGFIGISRTIDVTSEGQMTASDKRSGATANRVLSPEEIQAIGKLYSQALSAEQPLQPSACADCYIYDLDLTSDAKTVNIHLDDTNLSGSAAEPLVTYLRQLRDSALTAP